MHDGTIVPFFPLPDTIDIIYESYKEALRIFAYPGYVLDPWAQMRVMHQKEEYKPIAFYNCIVDGTEF